MADTACDRRFCPACDLTLSPADETCPECGERVDDGTEASSDR